MREGFGGGGFREPVDLTPFEPLGKKLKVEWKNVKNIIGLHCLHPLIPERLQLVYLVSSHGIFCSLSDKRSSNIDGPVAVSGYQVQNSTPEISIHQLEMDVGDFEL